MLTRDAEMVAWPKYALAAAALALPAWAFCALYRRHRREQARRRKRDAYPRDVVILHQYGPGLRCPSASPFVLKLETWLRMANIKYQNEFGADYGPKGKMPWITLNGEEIADSQLIIEHLGKKLGVDLSSQHSAADLGIARAFLKTAEESLYWALIINRYVFHPDTKVSGILPERIKIFGEKVKVRSRAQGYGLHTKEELNTISREDLRALDAFIGAKKFLLGSEVCDVDAAIFGMVAQFIHMDNTFLHRYVTNECPNILRYFETMKQTYWPDWLDRVRVKDQVKLSHLI